MSSNPVGVETAVETDEEKEEEIPNMMNFSSHCVMIAGKCSISVLATEKCMETLHVHVIIFILQEPSSTEASDLSAFSDVSDFDSSEL